MCMARLVYVAHGLRGSLYTSLALAKRLRDDGHEVTFITFRDVSADVSQAGFDLVHLSRGDRAFATFRSEVERRGKLRATPLGIRLRSRLIGSTEVRDTVQQIRPDLLIIDAEMHAAIIATRALCVPTVLAIPWFSTFRAPGLPPMHTNLRPPETTLDRLRVEAAWEWELVKRFADRQLGWLSAPALRQAARPFHLNTPNIRTVRALARFHNVDLSTIASWRHWMAPYVYPDIPLMTFTAHEMDFPHERPAMVTSVGVVIDEQRREPLVTDVTRTRWQSFRDRAKADGRPLIYASMGSLQTGDAGFYQRIVSVFTRRKEWALVLGLGAQADIGALGELPDNVLALEYAPQLEVLDSAAVAIHHGGIGTINECAWFEVPSIASSSGFVDEPGTATRLDYHGLGLSIDDADLTPQTLDSSIERLLSDRTIAGNLSQLRTRLTAYRTDRIAEKLIADQIDQHQA